MTGLLIAFLFIVAVVFLVSRLRPGSHEEQGTNEARPALPRQGVRSAPDGWVQVGASMKPPEAAVAQGLLESYGIAAAVEATDPMGEAVMKYPAASRWFRLCVAPEDAEEASALLSGSP